jgi:predicted Fe-Mo cluster-binding NifX family protein
MKIAIATDTANKDAAVSVHAARAPYYLVFDDDGRLLDTISNQYHSVEHGAALEAARLMEEHQINMLVAGNFGERFIDLLEENNIVAVTAQGPVSRVIKNVTQ